MAYDGSGTFDRVHSWADDKANGIKIRADRMDAEFSGMATGLSTAITKDGQTTTTARIEFAEGTQTANNKGYQIADSGGTDRNAVNVDASNILQLGWSGAASVSVNGTGITNAQIAYVAALDQGLATTSSPSFAALTSTGTVTGGTSTADPALKALGATTVNPRVSGQNDNGVVSLLCRPTGQDAGSIDPVSTGQVNWGNTFARWATIYGVTGDFTGTVTAEDVTLNGGFLNIGSSSALTIATGAITATRSHHTVDTEGGASTDTLETINGGGTGDLLLLRTADDARDVTIAETGNIRVPGTTFVLSTTVDCILLLRVGTLWIAVSPSDNA